MRFLLILITCPLLVCLAPVYAQENEDSATTTVSEAKTNTSVAEADTATSSSDVDTVTIMTGDDTVTFISAEEEMSRKCFPPCRPGYTCTDGECISMCNPPCPDGYRCNPNTMDCEQYYKPLSSHEEVACSGDKLKVNRKCIKKRDIITTGNVIFTITDVFFGMGTVYSAIVPFIVQERCWRIYDWDPYDSYAYYSEFDAVISTAPQTGMFVFAGALNQIPKGMQRDMLEELGEKPSYGLYITCWSLWSASIGTATGSIFSNITEDRETMKALSIINCIILFSSYFVSNATYFVQQKTLKNAVKKREPRHSAKQPFTVLPYYAFSKKKNELGVQVQF